MSFHDITCTLSNEHRKVAKTPASSPCSEKTYGTLAREFDANERSCGDDRSGCERDRTGEEGDNLSHGLGEFPDGRVELSGRSVER